MERERMNTAQRARQATADGASYVREQQIRELESYLEPDRMDMEGENARQPMLFYKVAQLLAEAIAEHSHAKDLQALAESQAMRSVYENLPEGRKMTVGEVDAMVRLDATVQLRRDQVIAAKLHLDRMDGLKQAYTDRSYKIHDALELQLAAASRVDMDARRQEVNEQRKEYFRNREQGRR